MNRHFTATQITSCLTICTSMWAIALTCNARVDAEQPPNFVLVLCDDLGYGDLGCYGNSEVRTPSLDQFAEEGLRLTSCYAAHPNCSPSRTGLMTGRTPTRVGIHSWIPMLSPMHVPESELTIATLLRRAGYQTALCGKWHLNGWFNLSGQPQPNDHGFDHWFATQNNCLPNHKDPYNFVRNAMPLGVLRGYAADLVVGEAIYWLRERRVDEQPFFLFVSFHEPHEPIATAAKYERMYPNRGPAYAAHHGNITQMDAAFGQLMQALDTLGLAEDTLVFFTSDNGPAKTPFHPDGSAGPLRDKKGYVTEGGIRVPGVLRWPGKIQPDTTSDVPVIGTDVLPTFCELAGVEPPQDRTLDGTSITPLFRGQPPHRSTPLYWHFYAASGVHQVAIRQGRWKLSARIDAPPARVRGGISALDQETIKTASLGEMELFNLNEDIAETEDVKQQNPRVFTELKRMLNEKYQEVQQESPVWPAWDFARYEGARIVWPAYRGEKSVPRREPIIPPDYQVNPLIETRVGPIGSE